MCNASFLIEQAINIAQETRRGLEFAHGRGIVHRLAVALDRSRLTTEGMMVGTLTLTPHPYSKSMACPRHCCLVTSYSPLPAYRLTQL